MGSTSQLTSFAYCKEFMRKYDILQNSPLIMSFVASMVGGVAISVMMTPFDLVATRLYNQGIKIGQQTLWYNFDCRCRSVW